MTPYLTLWVPLNEQVPFSSAHSVHVTLAVDVVDAGAVEVVVVAAVAVVAAVTVVLRRYRSMLESVSVPVTPGDVSLADKPSEIVSLPLVPPPQAAKTAADRKAKVADRERDEY